MHHLKEICYNRAEDVILLQDLIITRKSMCPSLAWPFSSRARARVAYVRRRVFPLYIVWGGIVPFMVRTRRLRERAYLKEELGEIEN